MSKDFKLSVFIFRRDLRIEDNTALIKALKRSETVLTCFIFDPKLIERDDPNLKSQKFMIQSIYDLQDEINKFGKLFLFYGHPEEVLEHIYLEFKFDAIFLNIDYSPFSNKRDKKIKNFSSRFGVEYLEYSDYLLTNPETIYTGTGNRYQVFTYFYKKARKEQVRTPEMNVFQNYYRTDLNTIDEINLEDHNPTLLQPLYTKGGRFHALNILNQIKNFKQYDKTRNIPSNTKGTTNLSPHIKFGTISIREVHQIVSHQLGEDHPLIRQLYWRDFYIYLSIHFDHVFNRSFNRKFDRIEWVNDQEMFEKWCNGQTGFPIVDAGMRQLNETGFMHNRVRMVVASFLVKDLHIDWRLGEMYFAKHLIDYDVMVNNGNWQWAASTGADAQPYFRIFNPWSQQKKFDPKSTYIKRYVPELRNVDSDIINRLYDFDEFENIQYPKPIVNHKERADKAKKIFKVIIG